MKRFASAVVAVLLAVTLAAPAAGSATPAAPQAGATSDPASTTLLVGLERGADRVAVHEAAGFDVVGRIPALHVDVVAVPAGGIPGAVAAYESLPGVAYAERNREVRVTKMPNDTFVGDQYALRRIRAGAGWAVYKNRWRRSGGVRIAIIDSGIDRLHPEFAGKITHCRSWLTGVGASTATCQDTGFHGTHVAGIAAATANNAKGIAGVAFDGRIMALQAINTAGVGLTADIAAAIVYAARNGARVANYSFGADTPSQTEYRAVRYAWSRKVTQVGAVGNTGRAGVEYPARYSEVIGVAATTSRDVRASFSTYGTGTEVAAPGAAILSTMPGAIIYQPWDGTSMAAPHVAGLAALLRTRGYSAAETRKRIRAGANDLGPSGPDSYYGHGRINVYRSLKL